MSIWNIIDQGYCPPPNTRIRAHRLHSCTDIQFDRDLIGTIRLNGNIPPGAARTFLHTDSVGIIAWKTFSHTDIPAGNNGDYLQTIAGLVAWAPPAFAPASITPGTARQLLQTDPTGYVAEWTSNVDIPGTLDVTGQTHFDAKIFAASGAEVSAGNLSVNTGDIAVLNGNLEVQTGALTVAGNINNGFGGTATFTNENITGNLQFASVSGSSGNFLKKTGAATQAFADIGSADIKGGTNNQFLQSNGTNAVFNTNITCPGSVVALGTMTTAGVMNMNGNLQFVTQSGATGNFIKKTTGTTQTWSNIAASDTKGGSNNQVMVSNGTNAVFSDSLSLPTSLVVGTTANVAGVTTLANNLVMSGAAAVFQMSGISAVALLNETRVYGQLKFGAVAGVAGTVPVSDAGGIPTWRYAQYFARYFDSTPVDMNNGGGGALTLLAAASPDVANANITYLAGVFTLGEAGHYNIRFQTNATTVGAGAQTLINIKTNGLFAGSYTTTVVPGIQSVVLEKSYMLLAAATVEVVSQQLAAGVINTSAADANAVATTVITITKIGPYI